MLGLASLILVTVLAAGASVGSPTSEASLSRRSITQDLMDQFIRFTKISFAADQLLPCNSPVGTTIVKTLNDPKTDTHGFVARDDTNKQIIAVFRGSESPQNFITDAEIVLVPLSSPGVSNTNNAKAHFGFLTAFNSVASDVLSAVSSELQAHPGYTLVSTGHSLGASLASLGGVSLASNFPGTPLKVFTFGQPRTGDAAYADLAEELIGADNLFRAVHTTDGVPTLIPQEIGYRHHRTEFWNFQDPSTSIDNVKVCDGQEDPTCSDSIPSGGINDAHLTYFGENVLDTTFNPSSVCS